VEFVTVGPLLDDPLLTERPLPVLLLATQLVTPQLKAARIPLEFGVVTPLSPF